MAPLALTAWAAASAAAAAASTRSLVPRAFDWRRAQLTLDPDCDWSKVGPLTEDVNLACCTRESPCNGQPPRVCPSGGCALAMADLRADPCAPSLEHLLDTAGGGAANGFSEALAVLERSCDGQPDEALIAAAHERCDGRESGGGHRRMQGDRASLLAELLACVFHSAAAAALTFPGSGIMTAAMDAELARKNLSTESMSL